MASRDGGPAFARSAFAPDGVRYEDCGISEEQEGMTLRDYFAAAALTGLLARKVTAPADSLADQAYELADAMIARRG